MFLHPVGMQPYIPNGTTHIHSFMIATDIMSLTGQWQNEDRKVSGLRFTVRGM